MFQADVVCFSFPSSLWPGWPINPCWQGFYHHTTCTSLRPLPADHEEQKSNSVSLACCESVIDQQRCQILYSVLHQVDGDLSHSSHNLTSPCISVAVIVIIRMCILSVTALSGVSACTSPQVHRCRYHCDGGCDVRGLLRRRLHGASPGSWFHGALWPQLSQWVP